MRVYNLSAAGNKEPHLLKQIGFRNLAAVGPLARAVQLYVLNTHMIA
jgi:hypothetical protein